MKTLLILSTLLLVQFCETPLFAQYRYNNWGAYFGGTGYEYVEEVATDAAGNVIITGKTKSKTEITTTGAYQAKYGGGNCDAFVAKFDSAGTLLWSTYFGGTLMDYAYAISVDLNNNIYIGGRTSSTKSIATPNVHQTVFGGSVDDGFIAKFSPEGALLWSTYYGGNSGDWVLTLTNDPAGNLYAAGYTGSTVGIATPDAYQTSYAGYMDFYLVKFDPDGKRIFSTYFGKSGEDRPHDLQIDDDGNIIMIGTTPSDGMATSGAYQEACGGRLDVSISKWTSSGQLIWSTYYGGDGDDRGRECSIDDDGNIYVTGFTNSENSISTSGSHQPAIDKSKGSPIHFDTYLVKFNANGELQWGTYFGGSHHEYGRGIHITPVNTILISGVSSSSSNIASSDGFKPAKTGPNDAYVAEFSVDGYYLGASYYGGSKAEPYEMGYGPSIDLDAAGNLYLATTSLSSDIPNAHNSIHSVDSIDTYDAVLTRFSVNEQRLAFQENNTLTHEINIYPNPVNDMAIINFNSGFTGEATIMITDLSGKSLISIPMKLLEGKNEVPINLSSVASGIYFVSIPEIISFESDKVIVNH
jgi:hypothetical protein